MGWIWLLGMASASVPALAVQQSARAVASVIHTDLAGAKKPSPRCVPRAMNADVTPAPNEVGQRSGRRISAEDTAPPSSDAIVVARFVIPMQPQARLGQAPVVRRDAFASPARRQRAP